MEIIFGILGIGTISFFGLKLAGLALLAFTSIITSPITLIATLGIGALAFFGG